VHDLPCRRVRESGGLRRPRGGGVIRAVRRSIQQRLRERDHLMHHVPTQHVPERRGNERDTSRQRGGLLHM
jgi:hypothetical protein